MQGFHPLMFISKFISFSMLGFLLFAGWVGVCYVKKELDNRQTILKPTQLSSASSSPSNLTFASANTAASPEAAKQNKESRLVYSCSTDKEHYHTSKHLSSSCVRIALSESAAMERGLKPCSRCISE
jgi:hypothetical protein